MNLAPAEAAKSSRTATASFNNKGKKDGKRKFTAFFLFV